MSDATLATPLTTARRLGTIVVLAALLVPLLPLLPAQAASVEDFQQWATKHKGGSWIQSALNGQKALYHELDSVPFRLVMADDQWGTTEACDDDATQQCQVATIEWDTTSSGNPAYEPTLTAWDATLDGTDGVDPTAGYTTGALSTDGPFTIWGGEITKVYDYTTPSAGKRSVKVQLRHDGIPATRTVVAWGGQISLGAADNPGGNWHFRLASISADGSSAGSRSLQIFSSAIVPVQGDLTIEKTASTLEAELGDTFTYTITVTNSGGNQDATNVTVTDTIPDELAIDSASYKNPPSALVGVDCTPASGQDVTCNVGTLAPNASATVTIVVEAIDCGEVTNGAAVTADHIEGPSAQDWATVEIDGCSWDVRMDKEASSASVALGGEVTYTITAWNEATATATAPDVVIEDLVPDEFEILSATYTTATTTADCAEDGQEVTCAVGDLAIGASATATIVVRATSEADSCGEVTNDGVVSVDGEFADSDSATVTITGCGWALRFEKTASTATVPLGGSFSYEIVVTNETTATATAEDVVVTDSVPSELDVTDVEYFNPSTEQNGSPCPASSGQEVTCTVGDLAPGGSAKVVITVDVTDEADSCGPVTNAASVYVNGGANPAATDTATVTITGCDPAVSIEKTASTATVPLGGSFSYEIVVTNEATATATAEDVVVTDSVPSELDVTDVEYFNPSTEQNGSPCPASSGQEVTCTVGDLAPGGSAKVVITVDVTDEADSCGPVTNAAAVSVDGVAVDTDTATVEITGCEWDVRMDKSASVDEVELAGTFTYTITAWNEATATATASGVVITDELPAGTWAAGTPAYTAPDGPGVCDVTGQAVTCEVGDLPPGGSAEVTIVVSVTGLPDSCGPVTNSAAVSVDGEPADSDSATVTITGCDWDVAMTKSASASEVDLGGSLSYTLTAWNDETATGTASAVVISDSVPDGLSVVSAAFVRSDGAEGGCAQDGQDVTCAVGDLAPGESAVATIVVTVTDVPDSCGPVTNDGAVFVNGSQVAAGSDDATVEITGCDWEVALTKSASASEVDLGETFTYTLVATNATTATATAPDVVVSDTVPGELSVDSASFTAPGGDDDCSIDGQDVTCAVGDLAPGETATVTIAVTATTDPEQCGAVTNAGLVTVDGDPVDSDSVVVDIDCLVFFEEVGAIEIVKVADVQSAEVGDTVVYTYVVTNSGNVTLTDIDLDDDIIGEIELSQTTLAPGESMVVTAVYVVSEDDVVDGAVTNVAVAGGTTPSGERVTDTDDATVGLVVQAVLPRVIEPPAAPVSAAPLPRTGMELVLLLALALAALGAGVFLVRRAREEPDATA